VQLNSLQLSARFYAPLKSGHDSSGMQNSTPNIAPGPVIDRAHLDRMTGGDASLAVEVLDLFCEQVSMWQRLIDPDSRMEDWLVGIHTVKGSARGIGAWDLAEVCNGAEEAARADSLTRDSRRYWGETIRDSLDATALAIATIRHDLAMRSLRS
jgi:HPt (histidine-containing phosphotransfer) domain-containing protein